MVPFVTTLENHQPIVLDPLDFERHVPALDLTGLDDRFAARDYLIRCGEKFSALNAMNFAPGDCLTIRSLMFDQLLLGLFEKYAAVLGINSEAKKGALSLIAVGGYGRQEMSLYSDIDLLFLYNGYCGPKLKELTEKLLYVLWDLKLEVGYAIRSVADCRAIMLKDHTVFTAILDARLLCGSRAIFQRLEQMTDGLLKNTSLRKTVLKHKLREREDRLTRYGGSVYLLEPNIKEGEGGLRDMQLIRWIARIVGMKPDFAEFERAKLLDRDELTALEFALSYFLRIRNELHLVACKKTDQLSFDSQEKVALAMGFQSDPQKILAVEKFMQSYYTVAFQVSRVVKKLIRRFLTRKSGIRDFIQKFRDRSINANFCILQGQIALTAKDNAFEREPRLMMEIFTHVQDLGLPIHEDTEDLIRRSLYLVNDSFRADPAVCGLFKRMMSAYAGLGRALFAMHAVHFFDAFIPEFRKLRNRVQHDIYHVYTVDTHSIFAIEELSKLATGAYQGQFASFRQAMQDTLRKDLLSLGLLFHDIGKGEGGNHSMVGAAIANKITERLGYPAEDRRVVEFLVLSHLIMPHLSQRRDLDDPALINNLALSMKTLDNLNRLYVLTWADIRAVSAEAWTDWKGCLLEALYSKTTAVLRGQALSTEHIRRRVTGVRQAILARLKNQVEPAKLEKFLSAISPRYVLSHTDDEVATHFRLIMDADDPTFAIACRDTEGGVSEVLIHTLNSPRVLALVTGVMLSLGINIFALQVFTLTGGTVLIKMHLQGEGRQGLAALGLTERLRTTLVDVLRGQVKVDDLIAKRQRPGLFDKRPVQQASSKIEIDNDVSAYHTVIDVYAHDRVGLLYDIICALTQHGCYVEVSKISTKVEQVVDTFYIKDIFGHKITSKDRLREVEKTLFGVINTAREEASESLAKTGAVF